LQRTQGAGEDQNQEEQEGCYGHSQTADASLQHQPDVLRLGHGWGSPLFDGRRWLLRYNGRRGCVEQIDVVIHDG
jgi:hypothetical protein